ncbi:ABC transporter ATP-binding protein [Derxia gummosa]|uniref:ABC transporter ATP-binding protein n=1 Tax=Derxia gummosa DSM 723 TaxID=1121388 RepID=A0A8B6X114_9BURK|nr:ABC transporter ATP-binding protein [Derxia gummosa]
MLELLRVTKSYGPRALVRDLDLSVAPGEYIAVMGESGIGKSTLLNMVAGLEPIDAGDIRLDGVSVPALDEAGRVRLRRERIGFVFQAFHVLPHLTLAQNVALPLLLAGLGADEREARARELLGAVGLGARADGWPRELSGGELQRVAIARALVHRPRLLLADEPTGNLDPDTGASMLDLFETRLRASGAAAVLVTHSHEAARRCDRIVRLTRDGLVAA